MNSATSNYSKCKFSAKSNNLPPLGGHKNFLGQNNIKNEFSTIILLRVQIFSKI